MTDPYSSQSMSKKNSYRLQRVSGIEEIASLINCPYNKPTFTDAQSKEMFREEYECADHILRSELRKLGEVDAIGAKEFSMGDPWNSSRKIGVTVNVNRLFSEKLIELLKDAVEQMPARYLVILSGEYESGAGTFYICINRDREVLGYSPNKKILDLFGFI